jgi:hypothetical protein
MLHCLRRLQYHACDWKANKSQLGVAFAWSIMVFVPRSYYSRLHTIHALPNVVVPLRGGVRQI